MRKKILALFLCVVSVGFVFARGGTEKTSTKYPNRPVEFIAPASPGGGTDIFCRLIVDIIQKNKLLDGNIIVVNKPGGGGTVGAAYAIDPNRDGNHTLIALNGAQSLALRASTEVDVSKLTPVAVLAMDEVLFVGISGSPYKNFNDVINAAKAKPGSLSVGVADNLDRLCVELIKQQVGIDLNSVYFDSAGEIATAMLGGHVAFGIMNPNECIGQIQAKKMVPLASFSEKRLEGDFAIAPTFAELGYPSIKFKMFRGIMGGNNMSAEVQKYWATVFEKVVSTEQWRNEYIKKNLLEGVYMGPEKFKSYLQEDSEKLYQMGKKIGLFK